MNHIITSLERYIRVDLRYFFKGGFWLVGGSVVGSLLSLALSVIIAAYVPKDVFGIYKYILSMAGVAVAFSLTGMNTAITQAVAQGREGIFKRSLWIQAKWSIPQALFSIGLSAYYFLQANNIYGWAFLLVAFFAPITTISNTYNSFLAGKKDFKSSSLYSFVSNIIYFIGMAGAILYSPTLLIIVGAFYLSSILANIYFTYRTFNRFNPNTVVDPTDISYGKHLSVMNFFGIIASQIDSIIVYHLLGPIELAVYNFALLIPERLRSLLGFIPTLAHPKLAERDAVSIQQGIKRKTWYLIGTMMLIAIAYSIAAPFVFDMFFPQYLDSVPYTQVASFVVVGITSSYLLTALTAQKLQKKLYSLSVINPLIRISLITVLIYFFGLWGAIFARLGSHLVQLAVTYYVSTRA